MGNIIEGMNIIEQTPIKDYSLLSNILMVSGIIIALMAVIISSIKRRNIGTAFSIKNKGCKIFLFFYLLGLGMALTSVIRIPPLYRETERYEYKCTLDDNVPATYIENFYIISVEDGVWTIQDKK